MRERHVTPAEAAALLVLVVVLVVLAIQLAGRARTSAVVSEMIAELQSLALHQESFRRDWGVYSAGVVALEERGFSRDARIRLDIWEATSLGWSSTASHRDAGVECHLIVGDAAPVGTARGAGVVACE